MKTLIFTLIFSMSVGSVWAQAKAEATKSEPQVIYKYKKHQEFDFENLDVAGEPGAALGDITISTRSQKDFKNKLPYRKNFDPEIKKALERVR